MSGWSYELVGVPDGREVEVLQRGGQTRALVWWTGTPGGAVPHEVLAGICDHLDLRIVMLLRPGYGRSTPQPGRRIADPPRDLGAVLAHLGVDEVVSIGFSGGGPHSLATAALVPACRAAAVVVSPAPRDAEGLDFYDGMGLANQEEWRLADQGEAAVRPWLEREVAGLHDEPTHGFVGLFGDCVCEPDAIVLARPARKAMMSASLAKALEHGCEGWLGDDLAMVTPWGFELGTITTPVAFWAGRQDRFVSWHHSAWMQGCVPGSDLFVHADHGHMSLAEEHLELMVQRLVAKAAW